MPPLKLSNDILAAALEGYEAQKIRIDAQIAEIRSILSGTAAAEAKPKRKVSAAARRRMARAQRLRWKKIKQSAEPAQAATAKPKRILSASARKSMAAPQKKQGAAVRKAAPAKASKKKAVTPEQSASAGA